MGSLTDIDGIGPARKESIRDVGIHSPEELAKADPNDLTDAMSEAKAKELIRRAKKGSTVIQTGDEIAEIMSSKSFIPSGISGLDSIMNSGWEEGMTAGIYGKSGTGKSQVAMYSLASAVEATGLPALYLETEPNNYRPERIQSFATEDDTQSQVHKIGDIHTLDDQEAAYEAISDNFDEDSISMVVIDSFNSHFRDEYTGRQELSERAAVMKAHLRDLHHLADELSIPILLLLQSYGSPEAYGKQDNPYGGNVMIHNIGYFLRLSSGQGDLQKATVENHPGLKEQEVLLKIGDDSIDSVSQ